MQKASNHHSSVPTVQNLFDSDFSDEQVVPIVNTNSLRESSKQSPRDLNMADEEGMPRHGVPKNRLAWGNADSVCSIQNIWHYVPMVFLVPQATIHKSRKDSQEVNKKRLLVPVIMPKKVGFGFHFSFDFQVAYHFKL